MSADTWGALFSPCCSWAPGWEVGGGLWRRMCLQSRAMGYFSSWSLSLSCCVHRRRRRPEGAAGAAGAAGASACWGALYPLLSVLGCVLVGWGAAIVRGLVSQRLWPCWSAVWSVNITILLWESGAVAPGSHGGRPHAGVFPVLYCRFWAADFSGGRHSCRMSGWSAALDLVACSLVGNSRYSTVGLAAVEYGGCNGLFGCWGASCWTIFGECYVISLLCRAPGWDDGGRLYLQRCLQSWVVGCLI